MDKFFGGTYGTYEDKVSQARPFSKCGACKRLTKLIERYNKLECETCKKSYDLPKNGSYKLVGERFCPLDGYQVLLYTSAATQAAKYFICPKCYNDSPFPDISNHISCNLCPEAKCQYSVPNNELKECDKCSNGTLIIDQHNNTKVTISCNYCTNHYLVVENITTAQRSKESCENCEAYLFKEINFKAQPQGFTATNYKNVCAFCHPEISKMIKYRGPNLDPSKAHNSGFHGHRGGRGRGGRKRGRGRGRGRGGHKH